MARYCDAKDLRALVPDLYRDAALADSAGGTEADAGLLAAVLESACNEVDALVEGRVRLPLSTVPRKLRVAAAYIALELLSIRRGLNLREDAAAKVQWWRTWLSKVGEGELRLDAPAPDAAGAFSGHSSSVAVRPSVTGTHGLMFGLLLAFPLFALVPAETSRAVEARTWAFDLPEAADVFDNPAEMEWAAGESLVLSYAGGSLSAGQTARWEVASGTNLWLALAPVAAGSPWTWSLAPTQTCLPSGRYAGRIAVYETDGTEATFARVAALQSIRVHQGAAGLATANPLAVLSDYALLSWATNRFAEVFQDIATNAAAIADLEETGRQHADALAGLQTATAGLGPQVRANQEAISDLWSAIGYVAKTNGAWRLMDEPDWYGLELNGERVFGAVLDGPTGDGARILSLGFGEEEGTLELTFIGAATNHLEACNDRTNWYTWDDCAWSYSGITGTVAIANAAETNWYRVVAEGAVYGWSNAAVVSYAPLYIGSNDNADNRVATVGDVASAMSRSSSAARGAVARRGYKDNYNIEPTNLAWKIEVGGAPYFADLAVGEYATVETNADDETVTNTVSIRPGFMSLNNQRIDHWSDLRAYIGSGFPLTEAADFAGNSATGVGSIQFAGSTNELAIIDGKLKYGGKSVSGIPNLEAGRNIELAVDTTNEVVTISTLDDVSFGDVQVRGDLTVYGQQNIQTIRRYYTNVYLGTQTNYVTTEIHTTNHSWEVYHVVTRTTNNVDEVINIGGDVDHSRAATVLSPSYSIDNHDTNAPVLSATGFWDYTLASLALGTNAVSSFNGWTGAVGIQAGSNIVFGTDAANRRITINATVPEIDLSGYATEQWVNSRGYLTQHQSLAGYVTAEQLAQTLENYAPASDVTVIATNMEEIVSALSNPVIQTPDHRKWTMQGRYANGQVTHVWVPYVGLYSTSIRVAMPDGRIFEMVGRYADGNTNIITHAWEEVTE